MAHQNKSELLSTALQKLNDEGTEGLAQGLRLLIDEAMAQECAQVLQAPALRADRRSHGTRQWPQA